jgi:hypothetical protein
MRVTRYRRARVEANARLTGLLAAVLLVLLAVEGATILRIRAHLGLHVFVGMVLVPPVVLKMGSTSWRFVRYYSGDPAYREKGPPVVILRLLGPFVVVLTVILLASGIGLVLDPGAVGGRLLFIHKASFVLWFGAMTIHVIGHLGETGRLARLELAGRARRRVGGAALRLVLVGLSLVAGIALGAAMLGPTSHYAHHLEGRTGVLRPG